MMAYTVRRIFWLVPVLFAVSVITFAMMHMAPGGPFDNDPSGPGHIKSPKLVERLNAQWGLDKPVVEQYLRYMSGVIRGDLGPSYAKPSYKVQELLVSRLPYSARLGIQALLLALLVGIPLGIVAALKRNTWIDYLCLFIATAGIAVPSFVLAIYLIIIFAVGLNMVPVVATSWDSWQPWVLPTITLAVQPAAFLARLARSATIEALHQDYVRTARAKGLRERRIVIAHVLKNSMIPVWTVLGPATAALVTGSFIVETVFSIPGVGRYFVSAIGARDYTMIMGTTLFYALLVAVGNLLIDITYGFFDPRIKVSA